MNQPISPETQSRIRALCESIAQRDQLGEDVQDELRGHIEDKLMGYLHGEEPVSEADAFLLAREHFGEASTVKALLHTAHARPVFVGLGRRIGIVLLLTLAAHVLVRCVLFAMVLFQVPLYTGYQGFALLMSSVKAIGIPLFMYAMLRSTRRRPSDGLMRWLATGNRRMMMLSAMFVLLLWFSLPGAQFAPATLSLYPRAVQMLFAIVMAVLAVSGPIATCLVWIWWCDQAPRTRLNVVAAGLSWALFSTLSGLITIVTPLGNLVLTNANDLSYDPNPLAFQWDKATVLALHSNIILFAVAAPLLLSLVTGFAYSMYRRLTPSQQ